MNCKHSNRKNKVCGKSEHAWIHLLAILGIKGGHKFEGAGRDE
jgi:hypothetical protein